MLSHDKNYELNSNFPAFGRWKLDDYWLLKEWKQIKLESMFSAVPFDENVDLAQYVSFHWIAN